jgi:lactoylglutathione lyase
MIYVSDVSRTVRFYEQALGASCDHAHDDGSYAELVLESLVLGVVDAMFAERHFPGEVSGLQKADSPAAFEIYVEVGDVDDVARQAVRAGATTLGDPLDRPWGQRNVFVRDPDGVIIELATARE